MKINQLFFASVVALSAFTACNDIDEAERFDGPLTVETQKNVLIEDFTGQRCSNCPKAADELLSLQQTYGSERLIAVSIHGGSLSLPDSETSGVGLATEQGSDYNTHYLVQSWPKGMVDRSGGLLDYEAWNGAAIARFGIAPKVDLETSNISYDEASRTLSLSVTVSGNESVAGNLQVWLTESNITGIQLMPTGYVNREYTHNHVFRASVSEPYGDAMTIAEGEQQTKEYTYTLGRSYWNAENMSVVIFFYNDADGVMQVIDSKIIK